MQAVYNKNYTRVARLLLFFFSKGSPNPLPIPPFSSLPHISAKPRALDIGVDHHPDRALRLWRRRTRPFLHLPALERVRPDLHPGASYPGRLRARVPRRSLRPVGRRPPASREAQRPRQHGGQGADAHGRTRGGVCTCVEGGTVYGGK